MKRILILILLLPFSYIASIVTIQAQSPKGKLFIIGGGDKPPEMLKRIIDESGISSGGYAVILPMSSSEPEASALYAKDLFVEAGLENIFAINCTLENVNSPAKADSIRLANLVYITGGDQARFMDIVAGSEVEKAIHGAYENGALIAGTSAGAALMSKIMITGNQLKFPDYTATFSVIETDNIETREGLGLIPEVIIDQHFLIRSRHNRLITAILQFPGTKGIGIDESTAILVTGYHAEVIGLSQVLVYTPSSRKVKKHNGKLGADNIRLDIYMAGESFSIKGRH